MKCADCSYYWQDELNGEDFPRCHCGDTWLDTPPCDYDNGDENEGDYYVGFDDDEDEEGCDEC